MARSMRNVSPYSSRVYSLIPILIVLAAPALQGIYPQENAVDALSVQKGALEALNEKFPGFNKVNGQNIRNQAAPLLARIAPGRGPVTLDGEEIKRPGGGTQHLWRVTCPLPEQGHQIILRYDVNTGGLIGAATIRNRNPLAAPGKKTLTKNDAIQAAQGWLQKLDLAAGQEHTEASPVVFAPQKSPSGMWQVWLQGRETPEGPKLTVLVTLSSQTEAWMRAVVVDRAAIPSLYLPHR